MVPFSKFIESLFLRSGKIKRLLFCVNSPFTDIMVKSVNHVLNTSRYQIIKIHFKIVLITQVQIKDGKEKLQ